MGKLTNQAVKTAKAGDDGSEKLHSDGDGLYLRCRSINGKVIRSWMFEFKRQSVGRGRMFLGDYPAHGLADARTWADEQRALLDKGIDPRKAREDDLQARRSTEGRTLGHLIDGYLESLAAKGKPTREQRSVFAHVPEALKAKPAKDITGQEIAAAMAAVLEKGKNTPGGLRRTADKVRAYLSAAFRAAQSAELDPTAPKSLHGFGLQGDPAQFVKKMTNGGSSVKDRVLSQEELSAYYRAILDLSDGDKNIRDFLICHLFTGQRIRQLASASVVSVLGNGVDIEMHDSKGRRSLARVHRIPLTGPVLGAYRSRGDQLWGHADPIDPDTGEELRGDLTRFCLSVTWRVAAISKRMVDTGTAASGFAATDIRRTVETVLMANGFRREDLAHLLSHGLSGVQHASYDRHTYRAEKDRMLKVWHDFVLGIQSGNVVELRPARSSIQ